MKKLYLLIFAALAFVSFANNAAFALDTSDWYQYNGYTTMHNFSVKFPTDWQSYIISDDIQGLSPKDEYDDDPQVLIQEFEGQSYDQVKKYFLDSNTSIFSEEDILIQASNEDLIAKKVTYLDKTTNENYSRTLIKRGSLIIAITNAGVDEDIENAVEASFNFNDNWHQYINFDEGYTFVFPSNLSIESFYNGVNIVDPLRFDTTIFTATKYTDVAIDDVTNYLDNVDQSYVSESDIVYHGIERAIRAVYEDAITGKEFGLIFLESGSDSFGLTDVNVEDNYPNSNYYDLYIAEMLEGFEFFDIKGDGEYSSYLYFPDVRDNHANAKAINSLVQSKVIDGYPDGTFKPDGLINRAELTKMIVATVKKPDVVTYNNCFPDVESEWYAPYICYALEKGWVEGYPDGKFRPENNINRAEAMKIVLGVLFAHELSGDEALADDSVSDVDLDAWYSDYFIFADNRDLLDKQHIKKDGDNYLYYPGSDISRKEVAEMIYRSMEL